MFARFMPQEGKFFDLFNAHAEQIVLGGRSLVGLIGAMLESLDAREPGIDAIRAIDAIESQADRITHDTVTLLHRTFITPIDRDQIHQLIYRMDDVLDLMQDVAETIGLYDIRSVTPEALQLAEITLRCCERLQAAVRLIDKMDNGPQIITLCREIDALEGEADYVMRAGMSKLFREEQDVRQVLKLKTIYELLESITDRCEDVANIIEGVVLENS